MRLKMLRPAVAALGHTLTAQQVVATPRDRGRPWRRRRAAWLREHPLCCKCEEGDRITLATQVDHVTPLWKGGADDETNLQSMCDPCHDAKSALEAAERAGRGNSPPETAAGVRTLEGRRMGSVHMREGGSKV